MIDREAREIMHLVASVRPSEYMYYYHSMDFVCVFAIRGLMRITSRMRLIGFYF